MRIHRIRGTSGVASVGSVLASADIAAGHRAVVSSSCALAHDALSESAAVQRAAAAALRRPRRAPPGFA